MIKVLEINNKHMSHKLKYDNTSKLIHVFKKTRFLISKYKKTKQRACC